MHDLPSLEAFRSTHAELADLVVETPTVRWPTPRFAPHDIDVYLKMEIFQLTGTFKARGAINNLRNLGNAPRITAVSAGNHAIAVAFAAQTVGGDAKLVMYDSANPARVERVRELGAEIVFEEPGASAFARMDQLVADEDRIAVHPFEGERITLATGGVALELHRQVAGLDAVIVGIGGGGLASGVGAVTKLLNPDCAVYGVEPTGADSMSRSLAAGRAVRLDGIDTIADSLSAPMALPYSFGICQATFDDVVRVSDDEMAIAALALFDDLKLAVEPACAAATAAVMGPLSNALRGKRVGIILCGSNIDAESATRLLARGRALSNG